MSNERHEAGLVVVVLSFNEETNLPECLASVRGLGTLVLVDSGSTDQTLSIARAYGAEVIEHPFEGHSRQWKWALEHLPVTANWVLGLDADQRLTPELRQEIEALINSDHHGPIGVDGVYLNRRQIFRGRWIRYGGYYPKYLLKLFRPDKVRFDERDLLDHHFYIPGRTIRLKADLIEANKKEDSIAFWTSKHNGYAVLHAKEELMRRNRSQQAPIPPVLFGSPDERILWMKQCWYALPLYLRPVLYFAYRYLLRLGFRDGKEGFIFHFLHGFWYRLLVDINLDELSSQSSVRKHFR